MAAAFALPSSRPPSWNPSKSPATSASKIAPAAGGLPEFGYRSGGLGLARFMPAGVPQGDAVQPGHGQPVTVRSRAILSHPQGIEHRRDKIKLAKPSGRRNKLVTGW